MNWRKEKRIPLWTSTEEQGCDVNFRIQRIRIFGSKGAQLNRQGPTTQFLALSPVTFVREEACKVGHGDGRVLMVEPMHTLLNSQKFAIHRLGFRQAALRVDRCLTGKLNFGRRQLYVR
jgi:hypothetical protein